MQITEASIQEQISKGKAKYRGESNCGHTIDIDMGGCTEVQFRKSVKGWRFSYVVTYGRYSGLVPFKVPGVNLAAALNRIVNAA